MTCMTPFLTVLWPVYNFHHIVNKNKIGTLVDCTCIFVKDQTSRLK